MGCCASADDLPEYSYANMDTNEEKKFVEQQFLPRYKGAVLSEEVELFISCRNLPKLDIGSPSDPFVVISQRSDSDRRFHEIAKTEMVKDNNNPEFTKQIIITYRFEEVQLIRLDIYDADNKDLNNLSKHDYIGYCEFVLGDLVSSSNSTLNMNVLDKKKKQIKYKKVPTLCRVRSEEIKTNHDQLMIRFRATGLTKMTWFVYPCFFFYVLY